jgi:GNAT superfamily N-acetyltransferase
MPARPVIRQATPADAELLARLRYEFRSMLDTPVESADAFVQRCSAWMSKRLRADARWCCWLAESSGVAVGVVWLAFIEKIPNPVGELESYGYITSFYVREDHRGSGIGSELLAAALAECDRRPVHSAILWPTPRSRSLYARHGFAAPRTMMERPPAVEPHGAA